MKRWWNGIILGGLALCFLAIIQPAGAGPTYYVDACHWR